MKTVFKYPIEITEHQQIEMPSGSELRYIDIDPNGVPCIWAVVNTDSPIILADIYIYGTGHPIPAGRNYLKSFQQGSKVYHVFF